MDLRLEAFGRLKNGESPREVSEALEGVSYAKALKWKKELTEAEEHQDVVSLLDVEEVLIHNIAEDTKQELEELGADTEILEGELEQAIGKIDKYRLLNEKVNESAIKLVQRIDSIAGGITEVGELESLVNALTKIQIAFFSKPANVAVFPGQGGGISSTEVSVFNGIKRL